MKTLLTALILGIAPVAAFAQCNYDRTAMSCADGTTYDAETKGCVPVTG
ncbi:hypothetical protein PARPLA_01869 [Rhodobacteraceae bacterium THAF1]|nr:hypothetical protein [Palleronia sp. THAF1]QFU08996.1 hypothetical protein FIU81_09955 [Palleronia sp. THAF1]VDC24265.1 hypothetical protein PARPLA_01869 [Rhodobacteraceae bacterium THAF1]